MAIIKKNTESAFVPGMTLRAFAASLLCISLSAIYINHSCIYLHEIWTINDSVIPIPAMMVLLGFSLFAGLMGAVFKFKILTKAEIVCVTFATMMAAPIMAQGFWHKFFGIVAATPVNECFDYIDAFDDRLWPHGPNLTPSLRDATLGGGAAHSSAKVDEDDFAPCMVANNAAATDLSWVEFRFDADPAKPEVFPDFREAFLVSVLARGENVESETRVFAETLADGAETPNLLFSTAPGDQRTWLHKTGFMRIGRFGIFPAKSCQTNLVLRIGVRGRGKVEIADPKFFSVAALANIYTGRKTVDEADIATLPYGQRPPFAVVKPAPGHPLRSLGFRLGGMIPFRQWALPMAIWGSYVLLLLAALYCVNIMMRRKWAESERYPMPNTRIPLALVGAGPDDADDAETEGRISPFAAVWRNRWVWAGFIFALLFGILKGTHHFNPRFPDLDMRLHIGDYLSNPIFGGMFNVECVFSLFICSVAVFFELNVLMSVVVGYWICRSTYFFGHVAGLDSNGGFPWFDEQTVGAYLGYFAIIMVLSAKYMWGVVKDAWRGRGADGEALSPRAAVVLFVLCHIGVALWSGLSGSSLLSMQVLFCFLVLCGFISAKYRVECGSHFGYFTPYNVMFIITALGGARVFGARGMLVSVLLSGTLTGAVFYLIPGMQFEMIEIGHRMRIKPRHIAYTCLVGIIAGLVIGGVVFLSYAYTFGSDNLRANGFFNYNWFVTRVRTPMTQATVEWLGQEVGTSAHTKDWGRIAVFFSAGAMAVLTVLRQYFAGFWFHPMGFLLGFTYQNFGANWGTLLVACAIRWTVLKIGGARAVRSKLLPFFIGVFAGCVVSVGIFTIVNGHAVAVGSPHFYYTIP